MVKATRLLERDQELELISALLQASRDGSGRLLIIQGPPGIGKTALLRSTDELAAPSGVNHLHARASEMERKFAYGVVRQLLENSIARASPKSRRELFAGAASIASSVVEPSANQNLTDELSTTRADPSYPILHSLYWLCVNLSRGSPLLLSIDDAQWADLASMRFVLYLAHRLEGVPVSVLLAARIGEDPSGLLAEIAREPVTQRAEPGALSEVAVASLVRGSLGEDAAEVFCQACHSATGGNPFLVQELVVALKSKGVLPNEAEAAGVVGMGPDSVAQAVQARLQSLRAEAIQLARAVGALGDGASLRHAATLSNLDIVRAGTLADALAAVFILRPGRPLQFIHPIVRSAVYESLARSDRTSLHRRAARLLAEDGVPLEQVAAHLFEAEPCGDDWAVGTLRLAAQEALVHGAPEAAVALLRRALEEPPEPPQRAALLHELGTVEAKLEPIAAVEHLRQAFELQPAVQARARTGLELLRALLQTGRVGEAIRVVEDAIAGLGGRVPELALQLEAELVSALRQGLATSPLADERLERWKGRVEGRSPAERLMLAHLAVYTALAGADPPSAAALAERALGNGLLLEEQSADSLLFYLPHYILLCADRFDLVDQSLKNSFAEARTRGSPIAFVLSSIFRSHLYLARGRLRDAEADAQQSVDTAVSLRGYRFGLPGAVDALIDPLLEQGKFVAAEAALECHGFQGQLPDSVPGRLLMASRGHLRLAEGRTSEGVEDFLELMRREEATGPANLFLTSYRSLAAVGVFRLGNPGRAVALAEDALARARRWGAPRLLSTALRHAGLVHPRPRKIELLSEAVDVLEGSTAWLARAHALTALGQAMGREGLRADGVKKLSEGLDLAHRCGAGRVVERARAGLAGLGARPRRHVLFGMEALTASELRVGQMAARGMTNREIAETLFVTVRTVEVHLTHAYQKLEISGREGLAEALQGSSLDG